MGSKDQHSKVLTLIATLDVKAVYAAFYSENHVLCSRLLILITAFICVALSNGRKLLIFCRVDIIKNE